MARVAMAERGLRFSDLKRFVEKVEESPDGCWIWKGAAFHLPDGTYGAVSYGGTPDTAHGWRTSFSWGGYWAGSTWTTSAATRSASTPTIWRR